MKYIGKIVRTETDIWQEYLRLALEDEEVGILLYDKGKYRHSVYFFLQAMEKQVRAKIFSFVNPDTEYFRNRVRTHNLDELLDFLIEIVSNKENIRDQVKGQLEEHVLDGVKFGMLHNNLRYPIYREKSRSYSHLVIDEDDADRMWEKLKKLKVFISDINLLTR